jgi:hypothetical protein
MEAMKHLGMDEKSFGRGQSYITLLTDLEQARVIEVVEDRTAEAAEQLWRTLTPEQKQAVEAVAVDMWEPFIRTIEKEVPDADVVHDKYHVSSYLKAAAQQHAEAFYNLGVIYSEGQGVQRDTPQALQWFEKAARLGHPQSQSLIYINGGLGSDHARRLTHKIWPRVLTSGAPRLFFNRVWSTVPNVRDDLLRCAGFKHVVIAEEGALDVGDLKTRVSTRIHVLTLSASKSVPEGILVNCRRVQRAKRPGN